MVTSSDPLLHEDPGLEVLKINNEEDSLRHEHTSANGFFFCSQILLPEQYLEITTLVSAYLALIFQEKGKQI